MLQHCDILNDHGYEAYPVYTGRFDIKYHTCKQRHLTLREMKRRLSGADTVVLPELMVHWGEGMQFQNKVSFVQAMYGELLDTVEIPELKYEDLGYTHLMCVSDFLMEAVELRSKLPRVRVIDGIDLRKFVSKPEMRECGRVTFLSRKNQEFGRAVVAALKPEVRHQVEIVEIDKDIFEDELIKVYQRTDIFMATGYPEGFGLPALEAMACGAVVVGCTGGGARQYMHDGETALTVADGDVAGFARVIERVVEDVELKESLRRNGILEAQKYGFEGMERELLEFARLMSEST